MTDPKPIMLHGTGLRIETDGSGAALACAASLIEDFHPAESAGAAAQTVTLRLLSSPFPRTLGTRYPRLFRTRMCVARGLGPLRVNVYDELSVAQLDASSADAPVVTIHSPDPELLYEIAYSAALSVVGELLDRRGLHRVHALGFSAHGRNALCVFGERAGKSTLAAALRLTAPQGLRIFSDETPLLNTQGLVPYANRLALSDEAAARLGGELPWPSRVFKRRIFAEKRLYPWKISEIAAPGPVDALIVDGGRDNSEPRLVAASSARGLAALTHSLVVGRGVAQMAEYLLRFDPAHVWRLSRIAASRARVAALVAARAPTFVFYRTSDPRADARALLSFLEARR